MSLWGHLRVFPAKHFFSSSDFSCCGLESSRGKLTASWPAPPLCGLSGAPNRRRKERGDGHSSGRAVPGSTHSVGIILGFSAFHPSLTLTSWALSEPRLSVIFHPPLGGSNVPDFQTSKAQVLKGWPVHEAGLFWKRSSLASLLRWSRTHPSLAFLQSSPKHRIKIRSKLKQQKFSQTKVIQI